MSEAAFKDKFIAFVDILGFKNMVEKVENGTGMSHAELKEIKAALEQRNMVDTYGAYGPTTCPESYCEQKDMDFKTWQVTDCIVSSCEVSPAGIINLISHCWVGSMALLMKGVMVRGYITRGKILHEISDVTGTGYQKAYSQESKVSAFKNGADERGTPFIEIDPQIVAYVKKHDDGCIGKMFDRMTEGDGDVRAIFPFKRLSHDFVIGGWGNSFDPEKEKESNQKMREHLIALKERVQSYVDEGNLSAVRKTEHYLRCLDKQLDICTQTDEVIDSLCRPFGGQMFPG